MNDWAAETDDDDVAVPPSIDITVPSVARGYDYALGGKHTFYCGGIGRKP